MYSEKHYSSPREGGSFNSEESQEFLDICVVIENCMSRLMKVVPVKKKCKFSPGSVENIRIYIDNSVDSEKLEAKKLDVIYTQIYKLVVDKYSIPLLERRDLLRSVYAYLISIGEAVE